MNSGAQLLYASGMVADQNDRCGLVSSSALPELQVCRFLDWKETSRFCASIEFCKGGMSGLNVTDEVHSIGRTKIHPIKTETRIGRHFRLCVFVLLGSWPTLTKNDGPDHLRIRPAPRARGEGAARLRKRSSHHQKFSKIIWGNILTD